MTDLQSWRMAFLKQARSDWRVYQKTSEFEWPYCHQLHYLQMATEKLSKALLVIGDAKLERLTGSHAAFVNFIRVVSHNRKLQNALGMKKTQLQARFKQLLPLANEIESLAPALAQNRPNPEYPWQGAAGEAVAPADYAFPLVDQLRKTPHGIQLLKYIEILILQFESLFL